LLQPTDENLKKNLGFGSEISKHYLGFLFIPIQKYFKAGILRQQADYNLKQSKASQNTQKSNDKTKDS